MASFASASSEDEEDEFFRPKEAWKESNEAKKPKRKRASASGRESDTAASASKAKKKNTLTVKCRGCKMFRHRIICATLSGRPVTIEKVCEKY